MVLDQFVLIIALLLLVVLLISALAERHNVKHVRMSEYSSFAAFKSAEDKFRTIGIPAMASLVSSVFTGLCVSFTVSGMQTKNTEEIVYAVASLMAAIISTAVILGKVTELSDEPQYLEDDLPLIKAAAEEWLNDPTYSGPSPEVLKHYFEEWNKKLHEHSLQVSTHREAKRSKKMLEEYYNKDGSLHFWSGFKVYRGACADGLVPYLWSAAAALVLIAIIIFSFFFDEHPSEPWIITATLVMSVAALVFDLRYCGLRGNRALKWYREYVPAVKEVRSLLEKIDRINKEKESCDARQFHVYRLLAYSTERKSRGFFRRKRWLR